MHKLSPQHFYLELEYDGTAFYGWQVQEGRRFRTVQRAVESALQRIFHKKLRVIVAGRTDRGVHARMQAINFSVQSSIETHALMRALNSLLPPDVRIRRVKKAVPGFNTRYCCVSRTYRYFILNRGTQDIFLRNYSWWVDQTLNIRSMRKAARVFLGKHDFSSFTNDRACYTGTCKRTVKRVAVRRRRHCIVIEIEADGFLRKMVRNIVSVLVEVGKGKQGFSSVTRVLSGKNRDLVGKPAPACGLFLWKVKYDKRYFR